MKQLKWIAALFIAFTSVYALETQSKRYEVKSGIIEYAISGGGEMMGITTQTTGTSKTVFKEWGAVEVQSGSSQTITMEQKEQDQEFTKLENGNVFVADFNRKIVYKYTPELLANSEYRDLAQNAKEIMESMGGKQVGEEDFMGYSCEVWEIMQVKLWLHKGILLKSVSNMMGIQHTLEATKIELDIDIADSQFDLPNYQIKEADIESMMSEGEEDDSPELTPEQMEQMKQIANQDDTEEDDEEGEESPTLTPEQMEQMKDLMNNFGKI